MANDLATTKPKATTASAPSLPASLRRLLADPYSLGSEIVEWTPPAVPPEMAALRAARQELERTTQPGSAGHIAWCLGKMAKGMAHRKADATDWAMRTEAWAEACGHFPDDLWSKATLELLQTKTYFPAPAEMVAIVGATFSERQRMLERVRVMLGGQTRIERARTFAPEPEVDRLRHLRDSLRRVGKHSRAAVYEGKLAKLQGRPIEPWAIDPQADDGPAAEIERIPPMPMSPVQQAMLNVALARQWRARGNDARADRLEREAAELAPKMFDAHSDVAEVA